MALAPHTIEHLTEYEARVGHPSSPLPLAIREAYDAAGIAIPDRRTMLSVIAPPLPGARSGVGGCCYDTPEAHGGHCHVCGTPTAPDQNRAAHAVAGFEDALDRRTNDLMRLVVTHCPEHAPTWQGGASLHDACSRDAVTPGSGVHSGSGGYCEALDIATTLGAEIIPGARYLSKFMRFAFASLGILVPAWLVSQLAVTRSQGQQAADFQGALNQLLVPGDATANHGYNAGQVLILSGSAPSTAPAASQAQTGTLLINWIMPATAFTYSFVSNLATATAGAISNVNASNTATAGYGRMTTGATGTGFPTLEDGTLSTTERRLQFAVGTSGSDCNFNTLSIVSGGACSMTSLVVTCGG